MKLKFNFLMIILYSLFAVCLTKDTDKNKDKAKAKTKVKAKDFWNKR
jgi:hypothetical protein